MSEQPRMHETLQAFPFKSDEINPPTEYAERRAKCPLGHVRLPSGHEAVLLVTYQDVAATLIDPRLSHDVTAPGAARLTIGPSIFDSPTSLMNKEGEGHRRIRRIVSPAFSPRRIQQWRPEIEQVVDELIDAIVEKGAPADIVSDYCGPLPIRIICRLLGVPQQDTSKVREWSNAFASAANMPPDQQMRQIGEFKQYIEDLVAKRRVESGDGLIADLIEARDGSDQLSEPELVNLVVNLIAAGNETTSNSLSRYLLTLLNEDRDIWDRLTKEPDLVPTAVDELLRRTILGNVPTMRFAVEDVELPSGTIKAGQTVVIALAAAQRDETVYPEPDKIILDRERVPLLAFGGGPHRCLGANLALAELEIAIRALLLRLPNLHTTTTTDRLRFTGGEMFSSPISIPVSW